MQNTGQDAKTKVLRPAINNLGKNHLSFLERVVISLNSFTRCHIHQCFTYPMLCWCITSANVATISFSSFQCGQTNEWKLILPKSPKFSFLPTVEHFFLFNNQFQKVHVIKTVHAQKEWQWKHSLDMSILHLELNLLTWVGFNLNWSPDI